MSKAELTILKPIPNYEGLYSITPDGRVWAHANNVHSGKWKVPQKVKGHNLLRVCLSKKSRAKVHYIEHLVQEVYGKEPVC